ncbi:hypothetical protein ACFPK9_06450 [Rubritalea spongiae]|uniref:Uncharacterized protein n=1 Tax=Rubritalea spongiae TaxID=430797 RepID=A0ABW5E458_9BACT
MRRLKPKAVNLLRDLAVEFESQDLEISKDLMALAHESRPNGPFIRKKLREYNNALKSTAKWTSYDIKLQQLVNSGEVAIIPVGFRCYTKQNILKKFGIKQASLPFDSGFFPPSSIASIVKSPLINLDYLDHKSHAVCMKHENHSHPVHGMGIKFTSSNYHFINDKVKHINQNDINIYLDSTFRYYTLDKQHNYILAHYNWHSYAATKNKNRTCSQPKHNIQSINHTLNKRIDRMFKSCNNANHVFFIYDNPQSYKYMKIDDTHLDLEDTSVIKFAIRTKFGSKADILNLNEISDSKFLLNKIASP